MTGARGVKLAGHFVLTKSF